MADPALDSVRLFAALLVAASLVALVESRLRVPYAVGLLGLGLLGGVVVPGDRIVVTPDLVLAVLLPGLVFDAAFRTHVDPFRWARARIVVLAVPGVAVTAVVVALVLRAATGLSFESGIIVGAMVGATDPAAVVATFRRTSAPSRLRTLVEGESLFNDGTGLVLFTVALRLPAEHPGLLEVGAEFLVAIVASAFVGAAVGWLAIRVLRLVDDHLVEATITLAAAYGAYVVAAGLGMSGLLATAVAGLLVGSWGRRTAISQGSADALDLVWEVGAFILTALTFLLVGSAIPVGRLLNSAGPIAAGLFAVLMARLVVVYGLLGLGGRLAARLSRRGGDRSTRAVEPPDGGAELPTAWLHVLLIAGIRGAVTVALALALPLDLPDRAVIQAVTFGIVLVTLVGLGLAAGPLVPRILAPPARSVPDPRTGGAPEDPG